MEISLHSLTRLAVREGLSYALFHPNHVWNGTGRLAAATSVVQATPGRSVAHRRCVGVCKIMPAWSVFLLTDCVRCRRGPPAKGRSSRKGFFPMRPPFWPQHLTSAAPGGAPSRPKGVVDKRVAVYLLLPHPCPGEYCTQLGRWHPKIPCIQEGSR